MLIVGEWMVRDIGGQEELLPYPVRIGTRSNEELVKVLPTAPVKQNVYTTYTTRSATISRDFKRTTSTAMQ